MGAAKNDALPPQTGRGSDVLLGFIQKNPQKTLWQVLWRFTGSSRNHENIMKHIGSMRFQNSIKCRVLFFWKKEENSKFIENYKQKSEWEKFNEEQRI